MFKSPKGIVYLILFVLYYFFNTIFPAEQNGIVMSDNPLRIFPQLCLVLIIAYSVVFHIKFIRRYNKIAFYRNFYYYTLITFLYVILYTLQTSKAEQTVFEVFVLFLKINASIFVMYGIYAVLTKRPADIRYIYIIYFVQIIYCILTLVRDYYLSIVLGESISDNDVFDSNAGFMLASMIPMCFMLPWKRLKIYIYFFLVALTVFSGQRAAALGAAVTLIFSLQYIKVGFKRKDYYFFGALFAAVLIPVLVMSIENIMIRNELDADRGSVGSGRSVFWMIIIDSYFDGDVLQQLFGRGYFSVNALLKLKYGLPINAHNGFLDHLYTFGIFGLFIYIHCYIALKKLQIHLEKVGAKYSSLILMMFFIILIRSMSSHGFFDISYIPFFMVLSIILAKAETQINEKNAIEKK